MHFFGHSDEGMNGRSFWCILSCTVNIYIYTPILEPHYAVYTNVVCFVVVLNECGDTVTCIVFFIVLNLVVC